MNYTNWADNNDDNSGKCGALTPNNRHWKAVDCSHHLRYVCKRDEDAVKLNKVNSTWECHNELFPNFLFPHKQAAHPNILYTIIWVLCLSLCVFMCYVVVKIQRKDNVDN